MSDRAPDSHSGANECHGGELELLERAIKHCRVFGGLVEKKVGFQIT